MTGLVSQRIDKWLWHARFARTRTMAQSLARSGRIRVNRAKNESVSRLVKIGDTFTMADEHRVRVIKIAAIRASRGPAQEAKALYEELLSVAATTGGSFAKQRVPRPQSRERRLLRQMKEGPG